MIEQEIERAAADYLYRNLQGAGERLRWFQVAHPAEVKKLAERHERVRRALRELERLPRY
jgi:hypothetical protein